MDELNIIHIWVAHRFPLVPPLSLVFVSRVALQLVAVVVMVVGGGVSSLIPTKSLVCVGVCGRSCGCGSCGGGGGGGGSGSFDLYGPAGLPSNSIDTKI